MLRSVASRAVQLRLPHYQGERKLAHLVLAAGCKRPLPRRDLHTVQQAANSNSPRTSCMRPIVPHANGCSACAQTTGTCSNILSSRRWQQQRRSYIFLNLPGSPSELYRAVTTWLADFVGLGPASREVASPPRVRIAVKLRDRLNRRRGRAREAVARMAGRGRDNIARIASARVAARDRYTSQLQSIRERWRVEGRRRLDILRAGMGMQKLGAGPGMTSRMNESLQRRKLAMAEGLQLTESEARRIRGNATYRYQRAKARVKAKIRARMNMTMRRRQQRLLQEQSSVGIESGPTSTSSSPDQAYTKQVVELEEPAKTSWFDSDGYPRTARDPVTGRFVNPWSSESTNGQHSLADIWKWRMEHRLSRSEEDLLPSAASSSGTFEDYDGDDDALEHIRRTIYGETDSKEGYRSSTAGSNTLYTSTTLDPPTGNDCIKLTWLGHSTSLVQMGRFTILTDPMFSNRASALQFIGPARYTKPALRVEELPPIDAVLISHDHYDHLDYNSVLDLVESKKVKHWVVPLGLKAWLIDHTDLDSDCIVELEWWQSAKFVKDEGCEGDIRLTATEHRFEQNSEEMISDDGNPDELHQMTITCTPSQHWSSRTPFDRNRRLWCSFAVRTEETGPWGTSTSNPLNFFFAGDTGLPPKFPLHQQIGDRLGPFDLSAIPIGAYAPSFFMRDSHVDPREAFAIHRAIRSRQSVGIHWGTFALADERYDEPPRLLKKVVREHGVAVGDFATIRIGGSIESPPAPR